MSNDTIPGLKEDCEELFESFVQEAHLLLAVAETELRSLLNKPYNDISLVSCLNALHTIKGTATRLELDDVAGFCHELESFVKDMEDGKIECERNTIDILLRSLDSFRKACSGVVKRDSVESAAVKNEKNVSVSIDELEKLWGFGEEATELHNGIQNLLKESAGSNFETMRMNVMRLGALILKKQQIIAQMKEVSLADVFRPVQNFVANYDEKNNQRVEMKVDGEKLMIDFSIGKALSKMLVHIVSNSLTYGIESVDVRRKMGKPEIGTITAHCYKKGIEFILEVKDDGYGFDRDKIISCAISKKLFDREELESMDEKDLLRIVFEEGFSTLDKISEISGRGFGMSQVKSLVESMNGRVELFNNPCEGSTVKIAIPMARPSQLIKALNVKILGHTYSIPMEDIWEIVNCHNCENGDIVVHDLDSCWMLRYGERLIPLVYLGEYLAGERIFSIENIVIIASDSCFYGLVVDDATEMEEMNVKKIQGTVGCETYCSGVSSTKCGEMSLVLDVNRIGKDSGIEGYGGDSGINLLGKRDDKNMGGEQFVLFDLKKHKNYAVGLGDVFRIEDLGVNEIDWIGNMATVPYQGKPMKLIWVERALKLCKEKSLKNHIVRYERLNVLIIARGAEYFGLIVERIKAVDKSVSKMDAAISDRRGIAGTVVFTDKIASVISLEFLLEEGLPDSGLRESLAA